VVRVQRLDPGEHHLGGLVGIHGRARRRGPDEAKPLHRPAPQQQALTGFSLLPHTPLPGSARLGWPYRLHGLLYTLPLRSLLCSAARSDRWMSV
jgi:hypothetical protein